MSYTDLFIHCIDFVLRPDIEGGYNNDPDDPGGETNMGITKRDYPDLDIKNLTREKAVEIYYTDYWIPMNLIGIKNNDAILQMFDMGVNAGKRTAIKLGQKIVGAYADGVVGPETEGLINNLPTDFVELYKCNRKMYYLALVRRKPVMKKFLNGWLVRVDKCKFV